MTLVAVPAVLPPAAASGQDKTNRAVAGRRKV